MATNTRLFQTLSKSQLFQTISRQHVASVFSTLHYTQKHSFSYINNSNHSHSFAYQKHSQFSFATSSKTKSKPKTAVEIDTDSDASDSESDSDFFSDEYDSNDEDDSDLVSDSDIEDIADTNVSKTNHNNKQHQSPRAPRSTENTNFQLNLTPQSDEMPNRLIISNINFKTNRNDLWELCENYGTVSDVHLPANNNRDFENRGFGFVTFQNETEATNALKKISGMVFNQREIRASYAKFEKTRTNQNPRQERVSDGSPNSSYSARPQSPNNNNNNNNNMSVPTPNMSTVDMTVKSQGLTETTVTVSGLPGNVNISQISKMFGDFGDIVNISISPYNMMGCSLLNAIVQIKLGNTSKNDSDSAPANTKSGSGSGQLSFQDNRNDSNVSSAGNNVQPQRNNTEAYRDRSVDKGQPKQRQEINQMSDKEADELAKEIDALLETSDDDDSDSDGDSDFMSSDSESDDDDDKDKSSDDK